MNQTAIAVPSTDILSALRRLRGTATVGDVVAATGLPADRVSGDLKDLLQSCHGHLDVSDSGELLYHFDPRLVQRGSESWWTRFRRSAWSLFRKAFKAWIVVMLVVYLVIFVVLILMALFANRDDNRGWGGRRGRGGRSSGGGLPMPNLFLWYWIWGPRWRLGRPYYGHRWEQTLDKEDRVPFYKKVFAFVFGPDRPKPTQQQRDRSTLRLIRSRRGVITTADLVEHNGMTWPDAQDEMGRLVGAYHGEALVTPRGELAYAFPELMVSAHGHVGGRAPAPAWMRLEYPEELTGNTTGANAAVIGINAFNLVAAATAPWFIFPRLHIGGELAWIFLVFVPVIFSVSFFAVPALRMLAVERENRRRLRRNVRRVLLGYVYRQTLEKDGAVRSNDAAHHVASLLKDVAVPRSAIDRELQRLAAELDADVSAEADGELIYRFPALRRQVAEGAALRQKLALDEREIGEIVYSTEDDAIAEGERELQAFDRELQSTNRIAYEDDFELVAFDEALARGRTS